MPPAATQLVSQLTRLRQLMDDEAKLQAKLAPITLGIAALREELLRDFTAAELGSSSAGGLRVTKKTSTVASVTDVLLLNAYRAKKRNWDLIPASVPLPAWRERNDARIIVPGTEAFGRVSLAVTRIDKTPAKRS